MAIILITGTPGVGKTTVAKEVATRIGCRYVNVADLALQKGLVLWFDEERRAYVVDVERVREVLRELATDELFIIDTHVVSSVPPELVEVAIVLRLDPRKLAERLRARGYPERKVIENVQAEILDACLIEAVSVLGEEKVFEIDVSGKTIEVVVEEALLVIQERRGNKPGSVNWLETLGDDALKYLSL